MGNGRLGYRRSKKQPEVGDLVVCINLTSFMQTSLPDRFVGLVLNKAITVCKIQVVESGRIIFWQLDNMMLWKETK